MRRQGAFSGTDATLPSVEGAFRHVFAVMAFFTAMTFCALFPPSAFPADDADDQTVAEESYKDAKAVMRAAKSGNFEAQCLLGQRYLNGDGVPKDPVQAAKWFKKAADQGLPRAMEALGHLYRKGLGLPRDPARAAKYYAKAAEYGRKWSQYWLAKQYLEGDGLPKDPAKACFWATIALRAKLPDKEKKTVESLRDAAAAELDPARLREIQNKANHYRTKSWKRDKGIDGYTGTGFVISRSGYILTNRHVVDGCRSLAVKYKDSYHPVTVKNISKTSDLAMLSFGRSLPQAFTIRSDPVREGEKLVIMGYPLGRAARNDPLLTTGFVGRAPGTKPGREDIVFFAKGVNFGSSGSAVLDASGMVVGVVWGKDGKLKTGETKVRAVNMDELRSFLDAQHLPYPTRASYGERNVKALGKDIRDMVLPVYCDKNRNR